MPGPTPTAMEDYVKVIYAHTEWQSQPITTNALAARLGLAASSVTEMVKKLTAQGLAHHEPYGAIELTERGRTLALTMVRRHRLIETWLVERFGYRWDEVHDEAEVLEHACSARMIDAIDALLGHPVRDPHGDPIPTRAGTIEAVDGTNLAEAAAGQWEVTRLSDADPAILREIAGLGLVPNATIHVRGRTAEGVRVTAHESAAPFIVPPATAVAVWLTREDPHDSPATDH